MKKDKIQALKNEERRDYKEITKKDRLIAQCDHKKIEKGEEVITLKPINNDKAVCKICGTAVKVSPMSIGDIKQAAATLVDALNCVKVGAEKLPEGTLEELGNLILHVKQIPLWYEKQYLDVIAVDPVREERYSSNGPLRLNSELSQSRGFHVSSPYDNYDNRKGNKNKKHKKGGNNKKEHRSIQDLANGRY